MENQCHHCERHTVLGHRLTLIFEEATAGSEAASERTRKLIIATMQGPVLRTMFSASGKKDAITKAKGLIKDAKARRAKKARAKAKRVVVSAGWAD